MASLQAKINTFKNLAKVNYPKSMGWSVFTECYDSDDIEEFVTDCDSVFDVGRMMKDIASIWDDRYENAKHESGEYHDGSGNY